MLVVTAKATFVGQDSCGFCSGEKYLITVDQSDCVHVRTKDGLSRTYACIASFLQHWTGIDVVSCGSSLKRLSTR